MNIEEDEEHDIIETIKNLNINTFQYDIQENLKFDENKTTYKKKNTVHIGVVIDEIEELHNKHKKHKILNHCIDEHKNGDKFFNYN